MNCYFLSIRTFCFHIYYYTYIQIICSLVRLLLHYISMLCYYKYLYCHLAGEDIAYAHELVTTCNALWYRIFLNEILTWSKTKKWDHTARRGLVYTFWTCELELNSQVDLVFQTETPHVTQSGTVISNVYAILV